MKLRANESHECDQRAANQTSRNNTQHSGGDLTPTFREGYKK
jgi:hypothetical protein